MAVAAPVTCGAWGPPSPLPAQGRLRLCWSFTGAPETLRWEHTCPEARPSASCPTGALQTTIPFQGQREVLVLTEL